jgi:radical SAM protein with 4Fe4S-binding SPASM domain
MMCKELKVLGPRFTWQEIKRVRENNRLLTAGLELTMKCNLHCIYCYAEAGEKLSDELDLSEILDAIDQAYDLGAHRIGIIGGGEPLEYEYLFDVIDYMHRKNISISLFTNATKITTKIAEQVFRYNVSIVMKMNSMNSEIQDKLAGVKGTYRRIRKGLSFLENVGYPDEQHRLVIESIICKQNLEELPNIWQWARKKGFIPFFERVTFQGRAKKHDLEIPSQQIKQLFERLLKIDETQFGYTWRIQPPWAARVCDRHYYNCFITAQGNVQPCTGVNITVGNIRTQKLADILNKSSIIKSLRYIDENIEGACKECDFLPRCYGCRGQAYQITGNFLAADPYCWKNPKKII